MNDPLREAYIQDAGDLYFAHRARDEGTTTAGLCWLVHPLDLTRLIAVEPRAGDPFNYMGGMLAFNRHPLQQGTMFGLPVYPHASAELGRASLRVEVDVHKILEETQNPHGARP